MSTFNSPLVRRLIELAIEEDLSFGDVTSELLESRAAMQANIIAREELIVCGVGITERILSVANYSVKVTNHAQDGEKLQSGAKIQTLSGSAFELMSIERSILNFLQRLSGVATYTNLVLKKASGIVVLDTRKTMPGWRLLDKYATSVGGAKNHRMHLGDMILVKNNHIDAAAGANIKEKVKNVLSKVAGKAEFYKPFQVEVRNEDELASALAFSPHAVLLDNMDDALIERCLKHINKSSPKTICEVSGGVTPERLVSLAALGVSAVSMGSLTTKARNVDISMKIVA